MFLKEILPFSAECELIIELIIVFNENNEYFNEYLSVRYKVFSKV